VINRDKYLPGFIILESSFRKSSCRPEKKEKPGNFLPGFSFYAKVCFSRDFKVPQIHADFPQPNPNASS
jgi:hypothetical protein